MGEVIDERFVQPDGFRWVKLVSIKWKDDQGRQRTWEAVHRTTRKHTVDGVAVFAEVLKDGEKHIVLVSQFRPPLHNVCIELPAGLIDDNETASQAAVRELREETGYVGEAVEELPMCFNDPGLSQANMQYVRVAVDANAQDNINLKAQPEDGESIQCFLVPLKGLYTALQDMQAQHKWAVDARLLSLAWGMDLAHK